MMQGRGVTNYSTSKPSHEYTTSTSEFDDALLQRGIVSFEQVRKKKKKKWLVVGIRKYQFI
jgi:hypothetical protein